MGNTAGIGGDGALCVSKEAAGSKPPIRPLRTFDEAGLVMGGPRSS